MRLPALHFLVLGLLAVFAAAWSKEDHEIFRLRDELTATEGENVTFYDFVGVKPSASHGDLIKAYRKKSKELHPDKAKRKFIASRANPPKGKDKDKKQPPGVHVSKPPSEREIQSFVKKADERFARLGVIVDILKDDRRDRYDYFMKNGFPRWKGTGYYYSRFRPGLGTVLLGLFAAFGGAAHYGALVLSWKRQVEFVDRYIRHARRSAWGDELGIKGIGQAAASSGSGSNTAPDDSAPMTMNRRQKRMMDKEKGKGKGSKHQRAESGTTTPSGTGAVSPSGERKRVVAENGKVLIVDSIGNVFLEEENEDGESEEFLLDPNEIQRPSLRDTMVYRLPLWMFRKTVGRVLWGSSSHQQDIYVPAGAAQAEADEVSAAIPTPPSSNDEGKKKKKRR